MLNAIAEAGGLSPRQYGFTAGKSTVDAVNEVVAAAREVRAGNHRTRDICMAVTLDVRNAFNSVRWRDILRALRYDFRIPTYLFKVLQDYLSDRWVMFNTEKGLKKKRITSGAAQGSVLGADLWNVCYNEILNIEMPEGVFLIAYADDVIAIMKARTLELLQFKMNQTMRRVTAWMASRSLSLAVQKTEIVLLTTARIERVVPMTVEGLPIQTAEAVKYLGIMLDGKLSFWKHICNVADKAARVVASLSRLMTNVRGPSPEKRKLLMSTAEAIMLYGAEVWGDALRFQIYRARMESVQRRGALRICSAYRTVSAPAAQIVAGVIPIHLLAAERQRIYLRKEERDDRKVKSQERDETFRRWRDSWLVETRGRWTARLIGDPRRWLERKHGQVNYYLTQFLTGHGYFRSYLAKIGKVPDPKCRYCGAEKEDAYHTFFECPQWNGGRDHLIAQVGILQPENIIDIMVQDNKKWDLVATFVVAVLKTKEESRQWEEE